jgi:hypothetical protein
VEFVRLRVLTVLHHMHPYNAPVHGTHTVRKVTENGMIFTDIPLNATSLGPRARALLAPGKTYLAQLASTTGTVSSLHQLGCDLMSIPGRYGMLGNARDSSLPWPGARATHRGDSLHAMEVLLLSSPRLAYGRMYVRGGGGVLHHRPI